jgi:peptidoglycan/LPS O-acetylase OafA/YrhL
VAIGLLLFGAATSRSVSWLLAPTPFKVLGAISFSVFLWHGFVIIADGQSAFDGAGGVVQVILTPSPQPWWVLPFIMVPAVLFWSMLSFALIERPFLVWGHKAPNRQPAANVLCERQ